ncbi:hypothetical protein GCM10022219_20570 [Microbacterium oryzae]|uniref:Uncharacterized protein n=1 Tax=Microbacterium oryzae TaxID=743009 RepID=A0A6I6DU75_9MICO|nr:hypothetical protein [Microbacterium oryzae]QGU27696.1 hypothetical protein D7D94_08445 [Microbacterium oryzae]
MSPTALPTPGRDRGSVVRLLLAVGAAALLLLGIWTSPAHESLEGGSVLPVSVSAAATPTSDAEVIVPVAPAEDELGVAGLCVLGALCGVLLAIFAWRALGGRPTPVVLSVAGRWLSALLPQKRVFSPMVTTTLLGISRT